MTDLVEREFLVPGAEWIWRTNKGRELTHTVLALANTHAVQAGWDGEELVVFIDSRGRVSTQEITRFLNTRTYHSTNLVMANNMGALNEERATPVQVEEGDLILEEEEDQTQAASAGLADLHLFATVGNELPIAASRLKAAMVSYGQNSLPDGRLEHEFSFDANAISKEELERVFSAHPTQRVSTISVMGKLIALDTYEGVYPLLFPDAVFWSVRATTIDAVMENRVVYASAEPEQDVVPEAEDQVDTTETLPEEDVTVEQEATTLESVDVDERAEAETVVDSGEPEVEDQPGVVAQEPAVLEDTPEEDVQPQETVATVETVTPQSSASLQFAQSLSRVL